MGSEMCIRDSTLTLWKDLWMLFPKPSPSPSRLVDAVPETLTLTLTLMSAERVLSSCCTPMHSGTVEVRGGKTCGCCSRNPHPHPHPVSGDATNPRPHPGYSGAATLTRTLALTQAILELLGAAMTGVVFLREFSAAIRAFHCGDLGVVSNLTLTLKRFIKVVSEMRHTLTLTLMGGA